MAGRYTDALHPRNKVKGTPGRGQYVEKLDVPDWLTSISDELTGIGNPPRARPSGTTARSSRSSADVRGLREPPAAPRSTPRPPRPPRPVVDVERVATAVRTARSIDAAEAHLKRLTGRDLKQVATTLGIAEPGKTRSDLLYAILESQTHLGRPSPSAARRPPDPRLRPALRDTRDVAEVAAVLAAEARRITGHAPHVDLSGSDLRVAQEHAEGILRGMEHAPRTRLGAVYTYGLGGARRPRADEDQGEYANARGREQRFDEIGFATRWSRRPDEYRASLVQDAEDLSPGVPGALSADPMSVAIHELGHVASDQAERRYRKDLRGGYGPAEYATLDVESEAYEFVGEMARRRPGSGYGNAQRDRRALIQRLISYYASTDRSELTAEAFLDVVLHGDQASALSQTIYAMVTRGRRRPARRDGQPRRNP